MNILSRLTDDELRLIKRCEELYARAENGIPSCTQFLSPREQFIIENRLSAFFSDDESAPMCFFYGGFPSAQRRMLCTLPSYVRYTVTEGAGEGEIFGSEFENAIVPLRIKSGGFVTLSHRDFLGAIIASGIERSAMGDIITDDDGAGIFVSPTVAGFIKNELTDIGRDKVKVSDAKLPPDFDYTPQFENIRGTVASPRLDAVIAELARCSRETAKSVINSGLAEHNYFTADAADAAVSKGDIISCRKSSGCKGGKFIIDSLDDRSSKGRIILVARRYT